MNQSEQTRKKPRRTPGRAGNILDLNRLPSMDELMGSAHAQPSADPPPKHETQPEDRRETDETSSSPNHNRSHPNHASNLELEGMPSMRELLDSSPRRPMKADANQTSRVMTTHVSDQNATGESKAVSGQATRKQRRNRRLPARVIIDGSNVCRSISGGGAGEGGDVSSLSLLLKLTLFLVEHGVAFRCVFDASESYALGRNSQWPQGAAVYRTLLAYAHDCFSEVPAGQSADETILSLATELGCPVISNDRFDKSRDRHQDRFPWVSVACKRLIRSETDRHGMIFWPGLGLRARPGDNPQKLAEELLARL